MLIVRASPWYLADDSHEVATIDEDHADLGSFHTIAVIDERVAGLVGDCGAGP